MNGIDGVALIICILGAGALVVGVLGIGLILAMGAVDRRRSQAMYGHRQ
jgi:hypothetical protein